MPPCDQRETKNCLLTNYQYCPVETYCPNETETLFTLIFWLILIFQSKKQK